MQEVVRHDIVHRAGCTKGGGVVSVTADDVRRMREMVRAFAQEIEAELERRFPKGYLNSSEALLPTGFEGGTRGG